MHDPAGPAAANGPWGQLLPPAGRASAPEATGTDYWPGGAGNAYARPSLAQFLAVRLLATQAGGHGAQEERLEHAHQFAHAAGWLGPVPALSGVPARSSARALAALAVLDGVPLWAGAGGRKRPREGEGGQAASAGKRARGGDPGEEVDG